MKLRLVQWCALLLLLAACPAAEASEYQFTWALPTPQGNAIRGADYLDAAHGFAVGDRGAVMETTDGGISWVPRTTFPGFAVDLEDVLALGPSELLAVGASPGIFRSTDAGHSWSTVANPSTGRLRDLERISGSVLCAVGDSGQVLRSSDFGVSWNLLGSTGSQQLHEQLWLDASNGYVLGNFIVRRTTNGGATWSPLSGVTESEPFNDAFFTDAQHGVILSDFQIWRTSNGGTSWSGTFPPSNLVYMGNSVQLSSTHWLVATNLEGASIHETTDGGQTWEVKMYAGGGGFLDFDRLGDGTLIAMSDEGDAFRSADNGTTWVNATHTAVEGLRGEIGALDVGPGGWGAAGTDTSPPVRWFRTEDGGARWIQDPTGPQIAFTMAIEYWDANRAIAVGDYGLMWRTTNGGQNWTSVAIPNNPPNGRGWNISTPGPGVAYASVTGQTQARVYRTTDYGATWEQRSNGIPSTGGLTGISFYDLNNGFVSGYASSSPRMFRTTDGGGTWTSVGVAGLPSWTWQIHWHDASTGLAAVYNSGGIYRTTNGGTSWVRVWNESAREIGFSDSMHGVATLSGWPVAGKVVVTDDGGATWSSLDLPSTTAGSCIKPFEGGFWVGGGSAVIMKVTRSDPAAADPPSSTDARAAGIGLRVRGSGGPRIHIDYALPRAGSVRIDVLDVTGRRIAVLEPHARGAGLEGSASWMGYTGRGDRAPDGVYFARVASDHEARAVKFVLRR
jgi:photosystem II stability/assembly factor-like uncharacterized protein